MMATQSRPKVLVLAGATSVGKSAVSMELCKHLNAEIVIADSVQVYRGLNIGANKPTIEEQLIIPHHLIDICDPSEQMNTAEFCEKATIAIRDIVQRNKIPILVGGSTMWLQWLVHGQPDAPRASEKTIKKVKILLDHLEMENNWNRGLAILQSYDSNRAELLPRNDWYRLRRYIEVAVDLSEGVCASYSSDDENDHVMNSCLTGARREFLNDFDVRCFFLMENRENLYHTIDQRCEMMIKAGLFEEVFSLLLSQKLKPSFPISRAIGYRQVIEYFCQRIENNNIESFAAFIRQFSTSTRNYAKKQCKWYRNDERFLFLKMNRSSTEENIGDKRKACGMFNPYKTCANEILHWISLNEEAFQNILDRQIRVARMINQYITAGVVDLRKPVVHQEEFKVLEFLVNNDAINGFDRESGKRCSKEELHNWIMTSVFYEMRGEDEKEIPFLTALEMDVRAGGLQDRHQHMKTFSSRILVGDKKRFEDCIRQADEFRTELWRDNSTIMEQFSTMFRK